MKKCAIENDRVLVQNVLINANKNRLDANYGYILIDDAFKIIFKNHFCEQLLNNQDIDSIVFFKEINTKVAKMTNNKIINSQTLLEINNRIIEQAHLIVQRENKLVSLIFFAVLDNELQSLLVNFVPVCDSADKVIFIQIFINKYDYWGNAGLTNLYEKKDEPLKIKSKSNSLEVRLTQRQEEIVFLLALGLGLRHAAQLLEISYGSLTGTIRDTICYKFDVIPPDTDVLKNKLITLGYNKLVPQSLCFPKAIVLDSAIRDIYFNC